LINTAFPLVAAHKLYIFIYFSALQMGISCRIVRLPTTAAQADLNNAIDDACRDGSIDGVLVQLPLPPNLDEFAVMERISPHKDVDGFHPINMGRMIARGAPPRFVPATALGCIELLERYNIDVKV
jgi:5,10-methylene-tetrahydrofolate dehydrogenase/methenyl tetrahydrofolate cyclohydrolase